MTLEPRGALRAFITTLSDGASFADNDDLVRAGVVSSLHLIELIEFLGDRFGVAVTAEDVHRGRLASVDAMAALVEQFA